MFDTESYPLAVNCTTFEGSSLTNILWRVQVTVALMKEGEIVEDITFGHHDEKGYIVNLYWRQSEHTS